jgi:hypothetical protein
MRKELVDPIQETMDQREPARDLYHRLAPFNLAVEVRSADAGSWPFSSKSLVPLPPLSESGPGNSSTQTVYPCIPGLLVCVDPT